MEIVYANHNISVSVWKTELQNSSRRFHRKAILLKKDDCEFVYSTHAVTDNLPIKTFRRTFRIQTHI